MSRKQSVDDDLMEVCIPGWAKEINLHELTSGGWRCTMTGDPVGIGRDKVTSVHADTPVRAWNECLDIAEGWVRFELAPIEN